MSHQTYFYSPKFNKKPIFKSLNNKYQEFTNAYTYSTMLTMGNNTPDHAIICRKTAKEWKNIKSKSAIEVDNIIKEYISIPINLYFILTVRANYSNPIVKPTPLPILPIVNPELEIPKNALAQKRIADEIKATEKKLVELNQIYSIIIDYQIKNDVFLNIEKAESEISINKDKISKLK